jgi:GWxTD domain-containing protein
MFLKMKLLSALSLVIIIGTILTFGAQAQSLFPVDSLRIHMDVARFRGDSKKAYVELYYAVSQRALTYRADSAGMGGGVELSVLIKTSDSVMLGERCFLPNRITQPSDVERGMNLVAISAAELPDGNHHVTLVGHDKNNPARRDTLAFEISIRLPDSVKTALSDIEIATNITPGNERSPFYKNRYEVIPNVQGVFGEEQVCFFYAEAYNLPVKSDPGSYFVRTIVQDAAGRELIAREKPRKRVAESSVIVDQIPVHVLPTGTYTLALAILDSDRSTLTSKTKKFFVYNPTRGVDSTLYAGHPRGESYAGMGEGDLNQEFAWTTYERSEQEVLQFESLSGPEAKVQFLTEFWKKRSPGLREEYLERVEFANANFRVMGREGYKTDRGRVHIIYGPPDDNDRHPNEPDTHPYEIWSYNSIQGGVIFVFVQRVANGQYGLVHSTHRNELHDDQWFQRYAQTIR